MRVAAGGIAKKYLRDYFGIEVRGYLSQLGPIAIEQVDWTQIDQNPFFCPDASKVPAMEEYMQALSKEGNSVGAKITVVASGVAPGLGEPVCDRLDAEIAHALMSINVVKGVESGAGRDAVRHKGH